MSNTNTSSHGGGIGFSRLLTVLFIGLKLAHVINWSWWWVFAPIWIPLGIALTIAALIFLCAIIAVALQGWEA
jgi:Transmembrane Fragile-X-F protein